MTCIIYGEKFVSLTLRLTSTYLAHCHKHLSHSELKQLTKHPSFYTDIDDTWVETLVLMTF